MLGWFAAMTVRKWSVLVTTNDGLVCSHDCKEMERSSYHKCWGWLLKLFKLLSKLVDTLTNGIYGIIGKQRLTRVPYAHVAPGQLPSVPMR